MRYWAQPLQPSTQFLRIWQEHELTLRLKDAQGNSLSQNSDPKAFEFEFCGTETNGNTVRVALNGITANDLLELGRLVRNACSHGDTSDSERKFDSHHCGCRMSGLTDVASMMWRDQFFFVLAVPILCLKRMSH